MENLTWYVYAIFAGTVVLATWLFLRATAYSKISAVLIAFWILIQSILGIGGFYDKVDLLASRFPLLVVPPIIFLFSLFITKKGRNYIDRLDIKALTIFHIIRVPVEITLLFLFIAKTIPQAMTFEGRNFDIISGLTAPIIFYFVFVTKKLSRTVLILWNIACMGLLLNVVTNAVLSLPGRHLLFGFEQPNIAVGYFPFLLLPSLLVPLALFTNAAAIRQLLTKKALQP